MTNYRDRPGKIILCDNPLILCENNDPLSRIGKEFELNPADCGVRIPPCKEAPTRLLPEHGHVSLGAPRERRQPHLQWHGSLYHLQQRMEEQASIDMLPVAAYGRTGKYRYVTCSSVWKDRHV